MNKHQLDTQHSRFSYEYDWIDPNSIDGTAGSDECYTVQMELMNLFGRERWQEIESVLETRQCIQEIETSPLCNPITIIHVACQNPQVPSHIIRKLIHLYHQGILLEEDEDGCLPIHLACIYHQKDVDIIIDLMVACPESCFIREQVDGSIPMITLLKSSGQNAHKVFDHMLRILPPECVYNGQSSLLHEYDHSQSMEDSMISKVLDKYPQVCTLTTSHGSTLLHTYCSRRESTLGIVQAIAQNHPNSCSQRDHDGNIPLHLVNSYVHSHEIIQFLMHFFPDGICIVNAADQLPLSSPLIQSSPTRVASILQCAGSRMHHILRKRNRHGMTPPEEAYFLLQRDLTYSLSADPDRISSLELVQNTCLSTMTQVLCILMTSVLYGSIHFNLRDAMIQNRHHPTFWTAFPLFTKVLLKQNPSVAKMKDRFGDCPLHSVSLHQFRTTQLSECSNCGMMPMKGPFLRCGNKLCCTECNRKRPFMASGQQASLIQYQCHDMLVDLLQAYPEAASIPDHKGYYPLHSYLASGWQWDTGMKEVFQSAPHLLTIRDKASSMFPFMIAAAASRPSEQEDNRYDLSLSRSCIELTTVFELLRRDPASICSTSKPTRST